MTEDTKARLKEAGLDDVDSYPDDAVEALGALSDDELKALAAAQDKGEGITPLGSFGGFVF